MCPRSLFDTSGRHPYSSGMGTLEGKTALIFGLANDRSLAWGIARALHGEGATLGFSYVNAAIEKSIRHHLSIWDAMVIEAAQRSGAEILYTEDLQHGQRFDTLTVINPFL